MMVQDLVSHLLFFRTAVHAGPEGGSLDHLAELLGAHLLHVHAAQDDRRDTVQANEAQLGEGMTTDDHGIEPAADLVLVESVN